MFFISDNLNKSILDPIHGLIKMTDEERKIISHELFNRLRKIKQNTFLYYVFPSANHTRFEHSIGVMHLASEMFLNSFHNASSIKSKQEKYQIEGQPNILGVKTLDQKEFEEAFLDLRIAALLHDIGHGPMSHLFDIYAPTNKDFIKMVKYDRNLEIENEELNKKLAMAFESVLNKNEKMEGHVEHEFVSYYFAAKVLKEINFPSARIMRILTIMNEELDLASFFIRRNQQNYNIIPFLNQIVAGAPLDCDRMDYLLRDSYFTGVKYGTYDLNRLLKSLLPYIDNEKKIIRLGIKKSGLPAIENFIQARYELYVQVYFHKTNQACNTMLTHATRDLDKGTFVKCDNSKDFVQTYLNLSDEQFLNLVKHEVKDKDDKETIDDLLNRRLWKRIVEIFPEEGMMRHKDIEKKIEEIKQLVLEKYPHLKPFLEKSMIANNPLKDLDKEKAVLLIKDENEDYIIANHDNWIHKSVIFNALSNKYLVGRVYLKADTGDEKGKKIYRTIKQDVQNLL